MRGCKMTGIEGAEGCLGVAAICSILSRGKTFS
jgi:hypothetical protein